MIGCLIGCTYCIAIGFTFILFSEFCWGKAMVVYIKPQQRKKESDRLTGEREIRSSLSIPNLKERKL